MTSFDHLLYRGEERPEARSALLSLYLLDRVPDFERIERVMERASRSFLRLRQRVVVPALPIANPEWVVDPDFDLRYHLRRTVLPSPGDLPTLLHFLEPELMAPLDRARPLWEAILVEGFDGDRAAFALKLNHAITDGMGGVELMLEMFDLERDPPERPMPPVPIPEDVTSLELGRRSLNRLPGRMVSAIERGAPEVARSASRVARRPAHAVSGLTAMVESVGRLLGGPPIEPSPLLRRRSLSRRLAVLEVPLDGMRQAAKAAGGSVNDAYLAAVGSALRRYHDEAGVPVDAVPAAIPVSVRADDDPAGGNQWAGIRVPLPVAEIDVAKRIRQVRELVVGAREEPGMKVMDALAPVLSRMPSAVLEGLTALASGTDVQASNIPGPLEPLYVAGSEVEHFFGFGPLPGPAMMIVLFSYRGTCHIGVNYDGAAVTDHERFERCLAEGFDEVVEFGRSATPPGRRNRS